MPLIDVTIREGRSPVQIRTLIHELHAATVRAIGANPDAVRVIIRELPLTHWASGDVTLAEKRDAAR
jgi:4-oxalocrotonate tautomerase